MLIIGRINCINTTSGICHNSFLYIYIFSVYLYIFYIFNSILYKFRATPCSSSGETIVSIQPLVYVTILFYIFIYFMYIYIFSIYLIQFSTCFEQLRAHHQENQLYQYNLCAGPTRTRNGHRHRVTYTRCCIDKIDSPDDEHEVARNM